MPFPNRAGRPRRRELDSLASVKVELARLERALSTRNAKTHEYRMLADQGRVCIYACATMIRVFEAEQGDRAAAMEEALVALTARLDRLEKVPA